MKKIFITLTSFFIFHSSFGMKKPSISKSIQAFFRPLLACVSSHHKEIHLKEKQEQIESQKIKDFAAIYWALTNKKNPVLHDPKPPIIGNGAHDLLNCIDEYVNPFDYQCVQTLPSPYQDESYPRITSLLYMREKNYLISSYLGGRSINISDCLQREISSIRCYDLTTNQEIHALTNPKVDPRNCTLTANSSMAWTNVDGLVSLGNPTDCTQTTVIKNNVVPNLLAYIPELDTLAMTSDQHLILLNIGTKKEDHRFLARISHEGLPTSLTYIPELKLLITGWSHGALQFFNPFSKTPLVTAPADYPHTRRVNSVVYLSGQNLLAVLYCDAIEIWDPTKRTFAWKLDYKSEHYCHQGSMIYLEDQHILACQNRCENITLWDTKNWNLNKPTGVSPISTIENSACERMIYAPAIKTIITGDKQEGIKMYANLVQIIKDALSKTATIK